MPKQTTWWNSFCSHDWINWMKKMTFDLWQWCFTLFISSRPCHFSSFEQCSVDVIFLWDFPACLFSYGEKKLYLSYCYYLINIINIKLLNFFSRTRTWMFGLAQGDKANLNNALHRQTRRGCWYYWLIKLDMRFDFYIKTMLFLQNGSLGI